MHGGNQCRTSTPSTSHPTAPHGPSWTAPSWPAPPATAQPPSGNASGRCATTPTPAAPSTTATPPSKYCAPTLTSQTAISVAGSSRAPASARVPTAAAHETRHAAPVLDASRVAPRTCQCCAQWPGGNGPLRVSRFRPEGEGRMTPDSVARPSPARDRLRPGRGTSRSAAMDATGVPVNAGRGTHNADSAGPDVEHPVRRCPRTPSTRLPGDSRQYRAVGAPGPTFGGRPRPGGFDSRRARP